MQTINPKTLKNFLNKQLTNATAQPSQIEGDFKWQIFPRPSIKMTKVTIGRLENPNPYSVTVNELYFNLQLAPLLHREIVFDDIVVDGFTLTLNTTFLQDMGTKPNLKLKKATKKTPESLLKFLVHAISFKKGEAIIHTQETQTIITDIQARATHVRFEHSFPLQFRGKINRAFDSQMPKAALNFTGTFNPGYNKAISQENSGILKGQLVLENLLINQFNISKIRANIDLGNQALKANPLNFNLYQGESLGDLSIDFKTKQAQLNQTLSGLSGQQLSQALSNQAFIKGAVDGSFHATTHLTNKDWLSALRAQGTISIREGALQWINFPKLLDDLVADIKNVWDSQTVEKSLQKLFQVKTNQGQQGQTPFKILTLSYHIKQSKILDHQFLLQSQNLELNGGGSLNLETLVIQDTVSAKFLIPHGTIREIQRALGGTLPLKITGKIPEPSVIPDFQTISSALSKAILKKTLKQSIKQLQLDLMLQ